MKNLLIKLALSILFLAPAFGLEPVEIKELKFVSSKKIDDLTKMPKSLVTREAINDYEAVFGQETKYTSRFISTQADGNKVEHVVEISAKFYGFKSRLEKNTLEMEKRIREEDFDLYDYRWFPFAFDFRIRTANPQKDAVDLGAAKIYIAQIIGMTQKSDIYPEHYELNGFGYSYKNLMRPHGDAEVHSASLVNVFLRDAFEENNDGEFFYSFSGELGVVGDLKFKGKHYTQILPLDLKLSFGATFMDKVLLEFFGESIGTFTADGSLIQTAYGAGITWVFSKNVSTSLRLEQLFHFNSFDNDNELEQDGSELRANIGVKFKL